MNIEYVGRHVALDDRVRAHAEERLGRVVRFLTEPIEIQVVLESEKNRQIAEIHVTHLSGDFHARAEGADLLESVGLAVDHLELQAKRDRKRAVDRRRRAGRAAAVRRHWPVEVLARESVRRGQVPRIVKSSRFEIKPMTLDEAALQLEGSRNEFVVFRDAESDRVSVLYKRRDEDYGLIAPES